MANREYAAQTINTDTYRPFIDGLRAIAVVIVVLFHAKIPFFSGGFVGVDVFFVISGYLISKHLVHELESTGKVSFKAFYARRIRRLMPALSVLIVATLFVWLLFFSGLSETKLFFESVRYSILGLANIFFLNRSGGYFDFTSDEMPLLHFWSLGVEEQFYLVWPLLLVFAAKVAFKVGHNKCYLRKSIITLLVGVFVISFVVNISLVYSDRVRDAFYLMPARGWEFAIGGLIAMFEESILDWSKNARRVAVGFTANLISIVGLFFIGIGTVFFTNETKFPGVYAIVPVFGAALLMAGCFISDNAVKKVISSKPFVKIGLLSYGIYLWHWPLFAMSRIWNLGGEPSIEISILLIAASVVLAYFSLNYIEVPIRKLGPKSFPTSTVFKTAFASCLIVVAAASVLEKLTTNNKNDDVELHRLVGERNSLGFACVDSLEKVKKGECSIFGTTKARTEIFVWGDSHAFGIFPMVQDYISGKQINATLYSNSSKPPFLPVAGFSDGLIKSFGDLNLEIVSNMRQQIKQNPNVRFSVVLTAYWQYCNRKDKISLVRSSYCFDSAMTDRGSLEVLERSLTETLRELTEIGVYRVLVMMPFPKFKSATGRCLQMSAMNRCMTDKQVMLDHARDFWTLATNATIGMSNVKLVNPIEHLCMESSCPQILRIDGKQVPVVFDDNHPSVSAAKLLGHRIKNELDWLVGQI